MEKIKKMKKINKNYFSFSLAFNTKASKGVNSFFGGSLGSLSSSSTIGFL